MGTTPQDPASTGTDEAALQKIVPRRIPPWVWIIGAVAAVFAIGIYQGLTDHIFTGPVLRQRVHTRVALGSDPTPAVDPPAGVFEKVSYDAPLGRNVAYVSPVAPGARRAALLWIAGGFDWGIGETAWLPATRDNDQSARAFRRAGIALMLPALRGANGNPGQHECFYGEVDDVLAAAEYLSHRPDVDPHRIYLGGHSTGGTLALLAAESTDRFRAVFAFGPMAHVRNYGAGGCLPEGLSTEEDVARCPACFLRQITTPTFVIEGAEFGNAAQFRPLQVDPNPAHVHFVLVPGANHFSVLAPGTEVIAQRIVADDADDRRVSVDAAAIVAAMRAAPEAPR